VRPAGRDTDRGGGQQRSQAHPDRTPRHPPLQAEAGQGDDERDHLHYPQVSPVSRRAVPSSARPLHSRYRPSFAARHRREADGENPVHLILRPDVLPCLLQFGAEPGAFRVGFPQPPERVGELPPQPAGRSVVSVPAMPSGHSTSPPWPFPLAPASYRFLSCTTGRNGRPMAKL